MKCNSPNCPNVVKYNVHPDPTVQGMYVCSNHVLWAVRQYGSAYILSLAIGENTGAKDTGA